MKNKQKAALRLLAALLALTLLAPLGLTASAEDGPDTIYIDSASDFVSFAKSCALDTWSAGKTVILRADISLAGMDYTPVAAFGGTFDGGGHTISDLNLTGSYSPAGLFAVILSGGSVEDLNVAGSVAAAGDKIVAGGIAGENYGRIVCCSFTGMVQGSAQIGGIAGVNRVSGQIISSTFDGKVQATNATGGIAGLNEGIIRHCTNTGSINTNNVDASLSLSDIQIDTTLDLANLTTSQTFLTTTETGGIAGTNTGLIAGCKNTGTVGYEHVGYNIGGIAGSTSGYLHSNTNEGTILGRKDVGGIAGQVEPYVAVTVSESTKDQLQTQLQDLRTLTDRATADAGGAASSLGSQLAGMGTYLDGAANAANNLRATATIDAGALADGSVTGGADLTVGDASAGIGAAIGAGKDADLTIDTHPLEIGSSTSAGIGAGVGGFVDPSDLSLSGGTDGSGSASDPATEPGSGSVTGTVTADEPSGTVPPAPTDTGVTDSPTTAAPEEPINPTEYYKNTLFIGDSRTAGLYIYGRIEGASYFARTSMNVGNCFNGSKSETGTGSLSLEAYLKKNRFGKIYILLGINEIGYSYDWIVTRYEKMISRLQELQPGAVIVIQSNMHVTKAKSDSSPKTFNNTRINELNRRLSGLADGKKVFYLSFESIFDGADGNMNPDYSGDGVHLKAKSYKIWRDYLLSEGMLRLPENTNITVITNPGYSGGGDRTDGTTDRVTEPPVTEPPKTEPPETKPPTTEPPTTEPPTTEPPTTEPPETEPPKAGDFAGADAEYINKDTLNYYCVTNEAYIPEGKKVTGIVLEFPGLGGGSCLGGSMDNMIAYNTPFARECAAKGIVLAYTFPGPWSWMNTGAVRMTDLMVDAFMDRYGWQSEDDFSLVAIGGSMGGSGALIYAADSRHTVDACVAHCPCYDVKECFSTKDVFPRAFVSAISAYGMPISEALETISPAHRLKDLPKIPYIVTGDEFDDCFPLKGTEKFVSDMKNDGLDVTYMFLKGKSHGEISDADRAAVNEFIFRMGEGK